ncbi:hypothetical protein [Natronococcus jeotgali]|uniref:Ig-like domain-containing protein n=1 Tax=Natronococcus jeotgali DSM 18795 TaxID=1227498 RepID=L9X3P9_9EURY|nr:hypothetical protein [Natronococcus jeotgali]ELY56345.1 hypothetical protein C492_14626 [Natronococcus jeotgali DSM 18795]
MNRRTLIGLATGVGTAALAGCLGAFSDATGSEERSGDEPDVADGSGTSEADGRGEESPDSGASDDTAGAVDVVVRNAGSQQRTVDVSISCDGESVIERAETLPAGDALEVTLREAGTYDVAVETDAGRSETTVTRSADCAAARTEIAVSEYGYETTNASAC